MVPASSLIKIPILTGPTATGKTGLALRLARTLCEQNEPAFEIINADSLLVYREMNIGTAKPTKEETAIVPHHLIDVRNPDQEFTAGDFVRETDRLIEEILARGKLPVFVGGTGFYLKARLYGLWEAPPTNPEFRLELGKKSNAELYQALENADSESALRIGKNDRYRLIRSLEIIDANGVTPSELRAKEPTSPDPRFELWVVDRASHELEPRVSQRTQAMLDQGLVDETRVLLKKYPNSRALKAVGYAQTVDFIEGRVPQSRKVPPGLPGLASEIDLATRQLVKRQRTWFRSEKASQWFTLNQDEPTIQERLSELLKARLGTSK